MKKFLPYAVAALLATFSPGCNNATEPTPQAATQTGAVTGQITPATGLTSITATPVGGGVIYTATLNPSGSYAFVTLPVGTYTISYVAAAGYATPAPQTVTVTVNNTVTLPAITVLRQLGTLQGIVTPVGALTSATATPTAGSTAYPATIDPATGRYTFANLPVGTYAVAYVVDMAYTPAPVPQTAAVTAGATTTLPTLALQTTRTLLLTTRSWRVTAATQTAGGVVTDTYASALPCQRDNFFRFNPNAVLISDEGPTKCSPTDPQTTTGSWNLINNDTQLRLQSSIPNTVPTTYEIVLLTNTTMQWRIVSPALPFAVSYTLTAF
ncbi:MAG: carboxypeptidase-like regulatory domain-containing protein [Bacteroidota bacterium]|nr:carboxypeptidase-like regulatory domain-containing protein [Bacteroidota bacterium]